MEALLSVDETAKLFGISRQGILSRIQKGKLKAHLQKGAGARGFIYKVPFSELPEKAKVKYIDKNKVTEDKEVVPAEPKAEDGECLSFAFMTKNEKSFDEMTELQRADALWRKKIITEWQDYRFKYKGNLAEADSNFLNSIKQKYNKDITVHQLYRYKKAYDRFGEIGLVDFRGAKNKGRTEIDKNIWAQFEYIYLDDRKPTAQYCYELTKQWAMHTHPDTLISSYSSFSRMIKQIPDPIIQLYRYGNKTFTDKCEKYITRFVEELEPNEIWVADNHTIDVMTRKDGTIVEHRMYLTAFFDARTRLLVGFNITDRPDSNSTLAALRDGIRKYGKPMKIYVDNGREFLVTDIGGRGHRKERKVKLTETLPPTILQLLDIEMINALPYNAKAKSIERWFREFTEHFSKLFKTYAGNTIANRPESAKYAIKTGNIVKDSEMIKFADKFINGYMNARPQHGRGMNGKSALQVWNENIVKKIVVPEEKLNLLLMRISRPIKVKQNGVRLNIYNETLWYYEKSFAYEHMNKTYVYLRYDPENLSKVRVYDTEDRFMAELPLDETAMGEYITTKEDISEKMKHKRQLKKLVKAEYNNRIYQGDDRMDSFEIMNLIIDKNLNKKYTNNAEIEEYEYEEKVYSLASGGDSEDYEMFARMAKNAEAKLKN